MPPPNKEIGWCRLCSGPAPHLFVVADVWSRMQNPRRAAWSWHHRPVGTCGHEQWWQESAGTGNIYEYLVFSTMAGNMWNIKFNASEKSQHNGKQYPNRTKTYSAYHSRFQWWVMMLQLSNDIQCSKIFSHPMSSMGTSNVLHRDMMINARGSPRLGANCTDCHNTSSLQPSVISSGLPPHSRCFKRILKRFDKRIEHD